MSESYVYTSLDNLSPMSSWMYRNKYGIKIYEPPTDGAFQTEADATNYVHTYSTWGLYPAKKPVISPAVPKTNIVELEGSSTSIDFTETLTGKVEYGRRKGTFEYVTFAPRKYWDKILIDVNNAIHGKHKWVVLDEFRDYFLDGRLSVAAPSYEDDKMYITITGDFDPYRRKMIGTLDRWLWNPFNFENGIIPQEQLNEIVIYDSVQNTVTFEAGDLPSTFKIEAVSQASNLVVTLQNANGSKTHTINAPDGGVFEFFDFVTALGENTLIFTTSQQTVVAINYRELSL